MSGTYKLLNNLIRYMILCSSILILVCSCTSIDSIKKLVNFMYPVNENSCIVINLVLSFDIALSFWEYIYELHQL